MPHPPQDGDVTSLESRWSCQPALGDAGSECRITYGLGIQYQLSALNIAMYKGDERTRTLDISIDNLPYTTWTSSGTTTGYEVIELDTMAQWISVVSVLEDSEWLSIMEVEIMIEDGESGSDDGDTTATDAGDDDTTTSTSAVEVGSLGTVTVEASFYDPSLTVDGGCDPSGCVADNTRDGDLSTASRWSCAPTLGGECSISYDLGTVYELDELRLAMYKGTERQVTMEVRIDDTLVTTWTSSGTTDDLEAIDLSGTSGQTVEITGVLDDSEWLSIVEVEIMVEDGDQGSGDDDTTTNTSAVEASTLGSVTVGASLYDPSLAVDGGCDPSGCVADNTRDGDLSAASRWSCAPMLGGECSISYDLGTAYDLDEVRLAMFKGTERQVTMEVRVDDALVITWTSSGTTDGFEAIDMSGTSGQVLEITGVLDDSEWLSIIEAEIMVLEDGASPTPTTPTPSPTTPSPATAQPVTSTTGTLQPVGLIPLAITDGTSLEKYHIKDGDMSTSWTCSGDPQEADDPYYDCILQFNMFSHRHIKQVKIALPDGAERAVDMRIAAPYDASFGEVFVTSSGTTDGFETYEFDYFTDFVSIARVFTSGGQSISISEVEFVEEIQDGEVSVVDFDAPYDNGDGLWTGATTDAFEWSSESDEAIDRTLSFVFNSYALMEAVELQFPVGETYKFELTLYDDEDELVSTYTGLESVDSEGWQRFELGTIDDPVTEVTIIMKGTGSGAPGFKLANARFLGTAIDNPSNTFYVGSTYVESWRSDRYPDFVAEGTGDQKAIMGAICAVKKASFDGVDCVGGDDAATGEVSMPMGEWFVDGNIFMKSGVYLDASFSIDDSPYTTDIILEDGAAGKTDTAAIIVMDGISDARLSEVWIYGNYDSETSNDTPAVDGLGSVGLSITGSTNITCRYASVYSSDGDALVVRDSEMVNIDAGAYDEEYRPWTIGQSRGTGIVVDSSDSVWIRRYTTSDNGVAGIHVSGSNNFTFEATIADECWADDCVLEGEGNVGSLDGQQPIEVIVESSTLVKFQDMKVQSVNDPVMTVSGSSGVSFDNCGFSNVESGTCVIQTDATSEVTTGDDPELSLDGTCYVKV
ncbi:unnamed protein product [Ectocarpus sp. 6 AP-2014]